MPDNLGSQLDALAPSGSTPPLPDAIVSRTRSIRRQRVITNISLASSPIIIALIAIASWMALSTPTPELPPEHAPQIATTDRPIAIPLTEATPTRLLQINKDLDPENLILPQVYTHTTSTPVPTPATGIRTGRSVPPSR